MKKQKQSAQDRADVKVAVKRLASIDESNPFKRTIPWKQLKRQLNKKR